MFIKIVSYNSPDYYTVVQLREKILRKPLGLDFSEQDLGSDQQEIIIAMFLQGKIIACIQLHPIDTNEVKFRQMAVDDKYQNKHYGTQLLIYAEQIARQNNFKLISLHARKTAIPFYQKNAYQIIGNEFVEVNIPHLKMQKHI